MVHETWFATGDATGLAHALASWISGDAGIRLLSIKGPVADHYRLRPPHASTDADVWVEPQRFAELCTLLELRGWHQRVGRKTPALLPQHSRTYIHDAWPCDIDVHWMFPGFAAEPKAVFDMIWDRREEMAIAGITVQIPSLPATAVIGALHALRSTQSRRHRDEHARIVRCVADVFSTSEKAEVYDIASRGRAVWVMRDLLEAAGVGSNIVDITEQEQQLWELHRNFVEDGSAVGWWQELCRVRWSAKPGLVVRALWVPRAFIPRNSPMVTPTRSEAWKYQVARWHRGARAMIRYVRHGGERRA